MFGLSFLSPLFLVGAAAAAIPIALHFFYRRTEPVVEFAAMRYLRQAPVEISRRRRLRELLLLALRVAALVLLACAFARPYLSTAAAAGAGATIVLVDTSASLTAPGQFERVRARAQAAIRNAPASHLTGVLAFGGAANVVAPLSGDRAGALAAVAALEPGMGATRFQAALHAAGKELAGRAGRVVVVTDLQQGGWEAAADLGVPENISVEVEEVEGPERNLAVTSLRMDDGEAIASVRSFPPRSAGVEVLFEIEGRRLAVVPVTLAPEGAAEARVRLEPSLWGALRASIADPDGYGADNARYAVVDDAGAVTVLAITVSGRSADALYLERALGAAEGATGFRFQAVDGVAFGALEPDVLAHTDVVVVAATRGLDQRGRDRLSQFVRSGGGVFVPAGPESDAAVLRQALGDVVGVSWSAQSAGAVSLAPDDSRHPVFRPFGAVGALGNATFTRIVRIEAAPGAQVLARFTDGAPALLEWHAGRQSGANPGSGGGRALVFASDLNNRWNDFPLQAAFVPFVHETMRYLASPRPEHTEYLVGDLPGPSGEKPGVVTLDASGAGAGRRVAVNTDPRESDPRRMSVDAFREGVSRLKTAAVQQADGDARQQESRQGLWRYGLLLMIVSLAAEGLMGRRTA